MTRTITCKHWIIRSLAVVVVVVVDGGAGAGAAAAAAAFSSASYIFEVCHRCLRWLFWSTTTIYVVRFPHQWSPGKPPIVPCYQLTIDRLIILEDTDGCHLTPRTPDGWRESSILQVLSQDIVGWLNGLAPAWTNQSGEQGVDYTGTRSM